MAETFTDKSESWVKTGQRAITYLVAATAMTVPFSTGLSTALIHVAGILSLVVILSVLRPRPFIPLGPITELQWVLITILSYILLSVMWAKDESLYLAGVAKYYKLLLVVLITYAAMDELSRRRPIIINSFLIGMSITAVGLLLTTLSFWENLSFAKNSQGGWDLLRVGDRTLFRTGPPDAPEFGRNHITQGYLFCVGIMISLGLFINAASQQNSNIKNVIKKLSYLALALIYLAGGFSQIGKTFLVLLSVCTIYCAIFVYKKSKRYKFITTSSTALFLFGLLVINANDYPVSQLRNIIALIDSDESLGVRASLIRIGLEAFSDNPLLGLGAGNGWVQAIFYTTKPEFLATSWQYHSELVNSLTQFGLIGTSIFTYFFYGLLKKSEGDLTNPALYIMIVNAIFNNIIYDNGEGVFFIVLVVLVLTRDRREI